MSITLTRPTKVVDLVTDLGLKAAHDEAVRALNEARNLDATDPREVQRAPEAARAVKALEERMRGSTVRFTLQAMTRKAWTEYVAAHQPAEGDAPSRAYGVDLKTLDAAIHASIVKVEDAAGEPQTVTLDEWVALADEMSNPQWEDFARAVISLNADLVGQPRESVVPFSASASLVIKRSEQTSKPPSGEGSASSD